MVIPRARIPAPAIIAPLCLQKKIGFNDFWWFISGNQAMSLIHYAVLAVMSERGKWKLSHQYYTSLLKFELTCETLWSLISKFAIFFFCTPIEYDKHFAVSSCISTLIWTINFCCRDINFVIIITYLVLLTPMYQNDSFLHPSSRSLTALAKKSSLQLLKYSH
jgi:hypothetical protein